MSHSFLVGNDDHALLVELALVEGELLTLEDIAVAAAGLARTAGDDGVQAAGLELLLDGASTLPTAAKRAACFFLTL